MIPAGTQIWIVAGVTDMRYGFTGLSAKVQNVLRERYVDHILCGGRRGFSLEMFG